MDTIAFVLHFQIPYKKMYTNLRYYQQVQECLLYNSHSNLTISLNSY